MDTKTIKTILKVFGTVFLSCYFLLMVALGYDYMFRTANLKFISWTQIVLSVAEFSLWIMLITGTTFLFLGVIPALIFLIFYFFDRKILASIFIAVLVVYSIAMIYFIGRVVYFIGLSWLIMISIILVLSIISIILSRFIRKKYLAKEVEKLDQEKKSNRKIDAKGWLILAINILIPYIFFLIYLALVGTGVDVFVQYSVFIVPLYIMVGIFNAMILCLLSRFDKRVLNIKFVFMFVICFSVLTLVFQPLLFVPVIFFFLLLSLTVVAMNASKIILKFKQ